MTDVSPNQPRALQPGDKVEPYTIDEQIGSGGQSVVYKATDELLGKQVAIKQFLFAGEDADQWREKIMTEARLHQKAAEADPKRLVQVIDVVDSPQGLMLISEYIDGPSLEQILAQNPLPMSHKQAMGIIAAAALALSAIHGQGIVHLDLKPANILMPRTGGLKISDFGLASTMADPTPPTAGTVRYMSPEVLREQKVDGRADLYALGLMAYEMLVGREKFDEAFRLILRDQRNQSIRWIKWHTNAKTLATPIRTLVPNVPEPIAEIVNRLMEKNPAKRYDSAEALLKAIKRYSSGKKPRASASSMQTTQALAGEPTTPGDTTILPTRSSKLKYLIIAAVLVVLLGSGGWFVVDSMRSAADRDLAMQAATALVKQADSAYHDQDYDVAIEKYRELLDNSAEAVKQAYGQHAQAGLYFSQGKQALGASHFDVAISAFNRAAELGGQYADRARVLIDQTRQAQAFAQTVAEIETHIDNRAFSEARKALSQWRELAASDQEQQQLRALGTRLEDQQSRWQVSELVKKANDLVATGQLNEAIELLRTGPQKLAVVELLAKLEARATADQAIALAEAALADGDKEQAVHQYEQAVKAVPEDAALQEKLTDVRSDWLVDEGLRMLAEGNTVGADQLLTEALGYRPNNARAREALKQIASSNRRDAFIEAGDAAAAIGDYDTAIKQYQNALDLGVDHPLSDKLIDARVKLLLRQSRASLQAGHIDKAGELVSQAGQLDPDNPDVAAATHEVQVRGEYLRHLKAGDEARARSAFGEAKRHYLRAKEAIDTPQVRARLDETEYDHLLAQARDYIAAQQYASARAQLKVAADMRSTDEVRELLKQVNEADPVSAP